MNNVVLDSCMISELCQTCQYETKMLYADTAASSHIPVFLLGMELFEEALQKWEQALHIRHPSDPTSCNNSLALQGATCGDVPMVTILLTKPLMF